MFWKSKIPSGDDSGASGGSETLRETAQGLGRERFGRSELHMMKLCVFDSSSHEDKALLGCTLPLKLCGNGSPESVTLLGLIELASLIAPLPGVC